LCIRSIQTEQKPIIEVGGIVKSVLIEDQRVSKCADLQQSVPIARIAGQAGDFQADHQSGMTHTHLSHEFLKTFPIGR
jgi:hypothetical protein